MCISAAAALAISTGVSVLGQVYQGQVTKQANDAKAQELSVAAEQSKVSAAEEAKRIRKAGEKTAGAARAALMASLVRAGADVQAAPDAAGMTVLRHALESRSAALVRALVAGGVVPCAADLLPLPAPRLRGSA